MLNLSSPMEQYEIYPLLTFNNVIFYLLIAGTLPIKSDFMGRGELVSNWWGILSESMVENSTLVYGGVGSNMATGEHKLIGKKIGIILASPLLLVKCHS